MSKEEFYKYGESLGIKINDLQRLKMLAMADKKYTEEDLRNAINETINACNIAQKESYGELEIDADKIINSLNKQD
jgi:hypothetical protein